jgi:ABC-type spermidine/putrescine transport system permease subunit II
MHFAIAFIVCLLLGFGPLLALIIVAMSSGDYAPAFFLRTAIVELTTNISMLFSNVVFWKSMGWSTIIAVVAAFLALPVALAFTASLRLLLPFRHRWALLWLAVGPLFSSHHLKAFATSIAFNDTSMAYSLKGIVAYSALYVAPYCVVFFVLAFETVSNAHLDCARNLGQARIGLLSRLLFRAGRMGLVAGFACAVAVAFGDPISPSTVGGNNLPVLPAWAIDQFKISRIPYLAAIGLVQAGTVMVLMILVVRIGRGKR